jgi:hypothetical protein
VRGDRVSVKTGVSGLGVGPERSRRTTKGVPPMFGVVVFEGPERRQVVETVVVFPSALAADTFATVEGFGDYEVTPVRLGVVDRCGSVVGRGLHDTAGTVSGEH